MSKITFKIYTIQRVLEHIILKADPGIFVEGGGGGTNFLKISHEIKKKVSRRSGGNWDFRKLSDLAIIGG